MLYMIAVIYSITEAAKANSLKPYEYFEYFLTEVPKQVISGRPFTVVSKLTGEHKKMEINLQQAAKAAYSCQGTYFGAFTCQRLHV